MTVGMPLTRDAWMTPARLRTCLHGMGFGDDREAEITVARACLYRGLVATGFGSLIVTPPSGERSTITDGQPPQREIVASQVWRVIAYGDRSDQFSPRLNWRTGTVGFELAGQEWTGGATVDRRYTGLLFDGPGVAALLADTDPVSPPPRQRGRPRGVLQYADDAGLIAEGVEMLRLGTAPTKTEAARRLIHRARGASDEAKLRRLSDGIGRAAEKK